MKQNKIQEINEVDPSIKEYIDETITAELDRILELSGISEDLRRNIAERGRASMGGGPGHKDPTFTSTAPGHAGSYGGGPESGPGDEEYGVRSRPQKWGTDYQAAMAKK
jgi:hypothetical protein